MLASQFANVSSETLLGALQNLQVVTEDATASEEPLLISSYNPQAASGKISGCAEPDLDSLEYSLDEDLPDFQRED